jgi:hypothetical protein
MRAPDTHCVCTPQAMTYGSAGSARELRARLRHKGSRCGYCPVPGWPCMVFWCSCWAGPCQQKHHHHHHQQQQQCQTGGPGRSSMPWDQTQLTPCLLPACLLVQPASCRGTVTYLDIHDDPAMTIGIFQLPPGARMPLHDHPGMTVFSRSVATAAWFWAHSSRRHDAVCHGSSALSFCFFRTCQCFVLTSPLSRCSAVLLQAAVRHATRARL